VVHPFEFSGKHDIPYVGLEKLLDTRFMKDSVEMMTYGAQAVYRTASPGAERNHQRPLSPKRRLWMVSVGEGNDEIHPS